MIASCLHATALALCIAGAAASQASAAAVADATVDGKSPAAKSLPATKQSKPDVGQAAIDVTVDTPAAWQQFLASADANQVFAAYEVLDQVGYIVDSVDADACHTHAKALREAIAVAPVGIALRRAGLLCAEASGDNAEADRELAALAALSKYALRESPDGAWRKPIRVLQPNDIYALTKTLGYTFRYEYYQQIHPTRYFPITVAVWDAEKKVERHLPFDYIDVLVTIDRQSEYFGFPYHHNVFADAYIKGQAKANESMALDTQAVEQAFTADKLTEQLMHLREGARVGGLQSLKNWIVLCASHRQQQDCADGLVDDLLPLAEQEHALPMTLLALAYAEGIGLKQDAATAETLLNAADKRWYRHGASVAYVDLSRQMHAGKWDAAMQQRLVSAVAAGNPDAEAVLVAIRVADDSKAPLSNEQIAILQKPIHNGLGKGYAVLVDHYRAMGQNVDTEASLIAAAQSGFPIAQRQYAFSVLNHASDAGKRVMAQEMIKQAALGGDAPAMRFMGFQASRSSDWKTASKWLLAAASAADMGAMLDMAEMMEAERPGFEGKLPLAVKVYRDLAEGGVADARRRLARMAMDGRGMDKNPAQAKQWLLLDADKGDAESQLHLGAALLNGEFGKPDETEGLRWLNKAIDAGSLDAKYEYANWLYDTKNTPESREHALRILREADAADNTKISNNLAWMLCVSAYDNIRDPASGLEVAKRMEQHADLPAGELDTVAACYAATGDFKRAIALQQQAMDGLPRDTAGKIQGGNTIADRLALYKSGKAYVSPVSNEAAD